MTRDFDRKESEREEYVKHHSSTRLLNERISELEAENQKLREQVKDLKDTVRELKDRR